MKDGGSIGQLIRRDERVEKGEEKRTNDELLVEVSEVLVLSDESSFSCLEEGELVVSSDCSDYDEQVVSFVRDGGKREEKGSERKKDSLRPTSANLRTSLISSPTICSLASTA